MRRLLLGAVTALSIALPAAAQSDPYAAEADAAYLAQRKTYTDTAEYVYFAEGCRVIQPGFGDLVVFGSIQNSMMALIRVTQGNSNNRDSLPILDIPRVEDMLHAAKRHGQAMVSGGCGFWHSHPDAVAAVRALVASTTP